MKGWIDGKYRILKKLGEGKDSTVYLCQSLDEEIDTVALKIYKIQEKNNLTELYFQRECDVLTMLNHKNIVNIIDKGYCQDKNIYYIALEYLEGTDLNKILKNNNICILYLVALPKNT